MASSTATAPRASVGVCFFDVPAAAAGRAAGFAFAAAGFGGATFFAARSESPASKAFAKVAAVAASASGAP